MLKADWYAKEVSNCLKFMKPKRDGIYVRYNRQGFPEYTNDIDFQRKFVEETGIRLMLL